MYSKNTVTINLNWRMLPIFIEYVENNYRQQQICLKYEDK